MFSVVLFQFFVLYTMDPLHKGHLNKHILSLVLMFPDKGLFTWRLLFKGSMSQHDRRGF